MNKQFFKESGVLFLGLLLSCLLTLAISPLAERIVNIFIVVDYFCAVIIRLVASLLTVMGVFGALSYLLSYKTAEFRASRAVAEFTIATLVQLALSLLFKFSTFISGGVIYLAGIFEHGSYFDDTSKLEYIGIFDYLPAFFIFSALYLLAYVVCGRIGAAKRLKDRELLLSGKNNNNN